MVTKKEAYPISLNVDFPKKLDRLSSFFRIIWSIPIMVIFSLLSASGGETHSIGAGITGGLFVATALMILFRQRYPRWWFNFIFELYKFMTRVGAYLFLMTDKYPSTEDEQSIHLTIDYPNVKKDLNKWLPLVKWFLAIPHYVVLFVLTLGASVAIVIAWFAILFTGKYPKGLFDYVLQVGRWYLRVNAYAFLLITDEYPPFSLSRQ